MFAIPVRTGLTTTRRYALEAGLTTEVINPLLNPQIARLNGSMGSLSPEGRKMESSTKLGGTVCGDVLVAVNMIGCAMAHSNKRQPKTAKNGSLDRVLICELFGVTWQKRSFHDHVLAPPRCCYFAPVVIIF